MKWSSNDTKFNSCFYKTVDTIFLLSTKQKSLEYATNHAFTWTQVAWMLMCIVRF